MKGEIFCASPEKSSFRPPWSCFFNPAKKNMNSLLHCFSTYIFFSVFLISDRNPIPPKKECPPLVLWYHEVLVGAVQQCKWVDFAQLGATVYYWARASVALLTTLVYYEQSGFDVAQWAILYDEVCRMSWLIEDFEVLLISKHYTRTMGQKGKKVQPINSYWISAGHADW